MKDQIKKLIERQLGELPKKLNGFDDYKKLASYFKWTTFMFGDAQPELISHVLKQEQSRRALLVVVISYVYNACIFQKSVFGSPFSMDDFIDQFETEIKLIEKSLSVNTPISWPEIVKEIEG